MSGYRTDEEKSYVTSLLGEREPWSWKWRIAVSLGVAVIFVGVVLYSRTWAPRETGAAFKARFGRVPQLSFDPQYYRGEVCGSFKFDSQKLAPFVFVSRYSSGDDPEGLRLESDSGYAGLAHKLCRTH